MDVPRSVITSILVIKLRAIGDVLLSTVVLNNLRAAFPEARIDFLTERPSREVVEGHPAITSALIFDSRKQSGASLVRDVRRRRYDCVIDLFGNPRSAVITLLSGARYRVGYRFGWRRICYNHVAEPRGSRIHNRDFNLDALTLLGIPAVDRSVLFPREPAAEDFAEQWFGANALTGKFIVALNPGGGWYTKRWRIPQFAALGDELVKRYGARILICWGPGEQAGAEELRRLMSQEAQLLPPTSLKQMAAILCRCSVMVTNDSGPMHIAAAVGTPLVAIFGPTNPQLQGPIGDHHVVVRNESLDCLGCNLTKCPIGNPCMEGLDVAEVLSAFDVCVRKNLLKPPVSRGAERR